MSDLERRLRDAMHGAAEQAPPGLIDAVRRRRRRYQRRAGAGMAAVLAAVAVAVPPAVGALTGGSPSAGGHGPGPLSGRTSKTPTLAPRRPAKAAPGTVLAGCGDGPNAGAIGEHWKREPRTGVGPMWFLDGGHSRGAVHLYVAIAVVDRLAPGSTVVVRVAKAGHRDLRFLYGPGDSLTRGGQFMRRGELGVTFVSCSPSQQVVRSTHWTDYYGGYLVRGARCVPVDVWTPGRRQPRVIRLGDCRAH